MFSCYSGQFIQQKWDTVFDFLLKFSFQSAVKFIWFDLADASIYTCEVWRCLLHLSSLRIKHSYIYTWALLSVHWLCYEALYIGFQEWRYAAGAEMFVVCRIIIFLWLQVDDWFKFSNRLMLVWVSTACASDFDSLTFILRQHSDWYA